MSIIGLALLQKAVFLFYVKGGDDERRKEFWEDRGCDMRRGSSVEETDGEKDLEATVGSDWGVIDAC